MSEQLVEVRVAELVPSRWQPRERFDEEGLLELAKHIRDHGLMYPVIVFRNEEGVYELVAGERRCRAIAALGLTETELWAAEHSHGLRKAVAHVAERGWTALPEEVKQALGARISARVDPAMVSEDGDLRRLHELAVADNIQRENLSALEEARALHDLMEAYGLTQRAVAAQMGWSQGKVAHRLSLLRLAPEAREALSFQKLSPTHARHIAKCPAEVQGAVTSYVEKLVDVEGDQAATVRQVAALTQQVRRFLKPERWAVPEGEVVTAQVRNCLRLVRNCLAAADLAERGAAIVELRTSGRWKWEQANLLGKRPTSLDARQFREVVVALTGRKQRLEEAWEGAAAEAGWTCEGCQWHGLAPPEESAWVRMPCLAWDPGEKARRGNRENVLPLTTCLDFVGEEEPLVVTVPYQIAEWTRELELPGLIEEPFDHFVDYEAWKRAVEGATAARAAREQEREQEKRTAHLGPLMEYWEQQQDGFFADAEHFQAHRCERCVNYRPEHQERELLLPPCVFAVEPLMGKWGDKPSAPDFGVLVRQDGLMVPRCTQFRTMIQEVAGMQGFRLPDREAVLGWLRAGLSGSRGSGTRSYTLAGPLAWLPYPRGKREEVHNLDRLLSYFKRAWDDLGDESMATLVTVGIAEARAMRGYRGAFELLDPTWLAWERWADVSWSTVMAGEEMRYGWPQEWPMPWVALDQGSSVEDGDGQV